MYVGIEGGREGCMYVQVELHLFGRVPIFLSTYGCARKMQDDNGHTHTDTFATSTCGVLKAGQPLYPCTDG